MSLKDESKFIRWQRQMEQKDDLEKIEHFLKSKSIWNYLVSKPLSPDKTKREKSLASRQSKKEIDKLLGEREFALTEDLKANKAVIA